MQQRTGWAALRQVHLWLGWVLAAWLLLMAASGAVLLFAPQLKALTAPACPAASARPLPEALAAIDRAFPGQVRSVAPASPALCFHEVVFNGARGGAYVDPASLLPVKVWPRNGRLTDLALELHRHLLLEEQGKSLVAALACITVLLTLAGVVLALRRVRFLSLRVWPRDATAPALLASHRNLGALLALPLLFMAASGLAMSYPKETQGLIAAAIGDRAPPPRPKRPRGVHVGAAPRDWAGVLAAAQGAAPSAAPRVIGWPARPNDPVVVRYRDLRPGAAGEALVVNVSSGPGGGLAARRADDAPRPQRIYRALHDLHAGRTVPLMTPLSALVAAALALATGLGLGAHLAKLVARRRRSRPPGGTRSSAVREPFV